MSLTSRLDKERIISVPKHVLKYRSDASPYGQPKEIKTTGSRILLKNKKVKSGLSRGQTMYSKTPEQDINSLITVERNFVRDLIKSPLKTKPPLATESGKSLKTARRASRSRFESLTICDFLGKSIKKRNSESRRVKYSATPDMAGKRKQ